MSKDTNNNDDITSNANFNQAENDRFEIKFQQVFFKDLSSTIPTLFEQLHAKDQQISKLNSTVNSLIEKNDGLQRKILSIDHPNTYYPLTGHPTSTPPNNNWLHFGAKVLVVTAIAAIFFGLGLVVFENYQKNQTLSANISNGAPTAIKNTENAVLEDYIGQREEYYQVISDYQLQLEQMKLVGVDKDERIENLSYTVDTLSNAVAMLSIQLDKEGKKSETIDLLSKQLETKGVETGSLNVLIDSLNHALKAEKTMAQELRQETKLLTMLNERQAKERTDLAAVKTLDLNANLLYLLLIVLTIAVAFMVFNQKKPAQ